MKYPMINNWLSFKRINQYEYSVHDYLHECEYSMRFDVVSFARKLNGKRNPYSVDKRFSRAEVDEMIQSLEEYELLRHSKTLTSGFGTIYKTMWIPKRNRKVRILASIWNVILNFLWLPVFILGVIAYINKLPLGSDDFIYFGLIFGIGAGMIIHELGHMCSGIYHGARVFEMGVMISSFLPGAYVLLDAENLKSKKARLRVNSAGVKSNILLSGVCLLLACLFPSIGASLLDAAINNAFLALLNIMFIEGFDGTAIISELLGIDDIVAKSKKFLYNKRIRKQLAKNGASGYAVLAVATAVRASQIAFPLLLIINGLEIIRCFT